MNINVKLNKLIKLWVKNDNNIIRIIAVAFFTFGFIGLGFELQNLRLRAQYILVSGFPFLLISIMYREYIWVFIIFMSLSMPIFFLSLVEFLLNFRNKKDNINLKIEGIISIIGSLLTIISSILSIMTFK
ncbi:TPA: hypothetical protein JOX81_002749 [Staphylococcus aureus]|jgi:hypothetical protein|uniref:hypothetical protein n=1 Tax=Staphylococcus TaxID=1279 RepID=UPI0009482530|nr:MULTISPECIES: hypothetical protein [Staphylococcus]MCP2687101.1 hypothetical protein [Staphylococcus aureus]MEB6286347.1 hypothetical protein [Staphylococcus haemolyticus]MEB7693523.1 hypothetical protein [Staphylococcus epidermidis]NKN66500.1 hypothetical protein [Staphylococcus haemolyticus]OLF65235.1 hypothetical protein BB045_05710 [Staphylococcus sp. MB377]